MTFCIYIPLPILYDQVTGLDMLESQMKAFNLFTSSRQIPLRITLSFENLPDRRNLG